MIPDQYVWLARASAFLIPWAGLFLLFPGGCIEEVWNHSALTGLSLLGMPVEELLFVSGFGLYWAGVYEHYIWEGSYRTARFETSPLSA